ncbi:MAG: OmpA family protein, partial [Myxococcales bacterium]|nr:OmpA family protein [Myxococcales bacterium]
QLVMIGPANPPPPVVVRFEGDSTVPSKSSEAELDAAAVVMKDHPGIALLRIEGHDDPSSGATKALALSRARAEAVVKALTQRGVDKSRLRAVGLGGYCPLAPSQTPDDRAKNRRAEFRVETSDEGLTAPEVGCPPSRNAGIR